MRTASPHRRARAVVCRPRPLLLDEPTDGLAPVIVQEPARNVAAMCDGSGAALLLSEQNIWLARRCTQQVYVLDTGRIVFAGDWPGFDADPSIMRRHPAI